MPNTRADRIAEAGIDAVDTAVRGLGYEPSSAFGAGWYVIDRPCLVGSPGLYVDQRVEPARGVRVWKLGITVAIYSPEINSVRDTVLPPEFFRFPETFAVGLRGLQDGRSKSPDIRLVSSLDEVQWVVDNIVDGLQRHADGWYSLFEQASTIYEYAERDVARSKSNHYAATIFALASGDTGAALELARGVGKRWTPGLKAKTYETEIGIYHRIGQHFGVDLPLVTWAEVQARR